MIIHRFVFLTPVQLPGKAPVSVFEPAAPANHGHTVTRTADGWLFAAPLGAAGGLSNGGRDELAAIGEPAETLAVLVPHSQVVVHYAGRYDPDAGYPLPTSAPTEALIEIRSRAPVPAPVPEPIAADPPPVAVPAAPPPVARRRGPPGAQPAVTVPPPSVGWVTDP